MLQRYRGIVRVSGLVMLGLVFMALLEIDVVGQGTFPSPHIFHISMSGCTHEPRERTQTGFRVWGIPGIVTALHGVVDCNKITATSGNVDGPVYNNLTLTMVDLESDVAVLATAGNMGATGLREPSSSRSTSIWDRPQLIGYPAGLQLQLITRNISLRNILSSGGWYDVLLWDLVPPGDKRNTLADRKSPGLDKVIISVEGVMTHGHSGAPLLNDSWQVLGVANGGLASGSWEISWAIPWSEVDLVDMDSLDRNAQAHLAKLRRLNPTESGLLDSYSSSFGPKDAIGENTFSGASRIHMPNGVERLIVRTGPGFRYARSFLLSDGQRVTIIDSNDSETWLKVRTSSDQEGWISAAYSRPDPSSGGTTQSTAAECTYKADRQLDQYWNYDALGCAFGPSKIIYAAWQTFEGGYTLWRRDHSQIYGFFGDGSWVAVDDTWDQRSAINIEGTPPAGLQKPERGFGYIWSTNPRFSHNLGWATDREKGFCAVIQDFEGGFILQSSQTPEFCHEENLHNYAREETFGLRYVVADNTGTWFRQ